MTAQQTRASIARWLRKLAYQTGGSSRVIYLALADAVERGDDLQEDET